MTKSSIEMAKTMMKLATIAGRSNGRRTSRSALHGRRTEVRRASSYSGPIESSRPRTMMTTNEIEKVTCPRSCAIVPSWTNCEQVDEVRKSAEPITSSGVTIGNSVEKRAVPGPRPRQRVSAIARATPIGTAISIVRRGELEALEERLPERGIVLDREVRLVPVPARRPALRRAPRAAVVEGETDRDQDRDDRPDEVEEREEQRGSAAVPQGFRHQSTQSPHRSSRPAHPRRVMR